MGLLDADLLLGLVELAAHRAAVASAPRRASSASGRRSAASRWRASGLLGAQRGVFLQTLPALGLGGEVVELAAPLGVVPLQLGEAALRMRRLSRRRASSPSRRVSSELTAPERALGLLHALVGGELGLAGGLEAAFELLQVGRSASMRRVASASLSARPGAARRASLRFISHSRFWRSEGGVEGAELLGHRGLDFEAADLLAELVADVLEAGEVVAGVGRAALRSPGDARGIW